MESLSLQNRHTGETLRTRRERDVSGQVTAGETLLEFSGRVVPAVDLDQYLQAIFAVLNASPTNRPSIFYLAHVLWRHRRTQRVVKPPVSVQRVLFPMVLLIGHVLGKYKGQGWPGCPETCTGAPLSEAAIA